MYTPFRRPKLIKPFPLEKVRILVIQFIACSLAFIACGIIFLLLCFAYEDEELSTLLQNLGSFNQNAFYLMRGVCGIQIFLGTIGLLVHCTGYAPKSLSSFPSGYRIPFGMLGLASYESFKLGVRNFYTQLEKVTNREAIYYTHREIFRPFSNDQLLMKQFEEKFECCGLKSPQDWLLSSCDCLPVSCCKPDKLEVCRDTVTFKETGALRNLSSQRSKLLEAANHHAEDLFYWNNGCQHKIMETLAQIGTTTGALVASLFTIHFILAMWMSHLIQMIFHLFDTREGYAQLQIYTAQIPSKNMKIKENFKSYIRALDPLSCDLSEENLDASKKRTVKANDKKHKADKESSSSSSSSSSSYPGSVDSGNTSILYVSEKSSSKSKDQDQ